MFYVWAFRHTIHILPEVKEAGGANILPLIGKNYQLSSSDFGVTMWPMACCIWRHVQFVFGEDQISHFEWPAWWCTIQLEKDTQNKKLLFLCRNCYFVWNVTSKAPLAYVTSLCNHMQTLGVQIFNGVQLLPVSWTVIFVSVDLLETVDIVHRYIHRAHTYTHMCIHVTI